jgi:hypothetical protein
MKKYEDIPVTETYRGEKIIVTMNKQGFFHSNFTGTERFTFSSDAIISAKTIIDKKMRK